MMTDCVPQKRWSGWIVTPVFLLVFSVNLLFFDLLFRLFGRIPRAYDLLLTGINRGVLLCLRMVGTSFTIFYVDGPLPPGGPLVIASNHQSLFDIPLVQSVGRPYRPLFVSKKELARKLPGVSVALRIGGHGLIDRKTPQQAFAELDRLGRLIAEEHRAVVLFPEGTRARDGELKNFKTSGLARYAVGPYRLPILPMAIDGSWRLSRFKCCPIPVGVRVTVAVGKPMTFELDTPVADVGVAVQAEVARLLNLLRSQTLSGGASLW